MKTRCDCNPEEFNLTDISLSVYCSLSHKCMGAVTANANRTAAASAVSHSKPVKASETQGGHYYEAVTGNAMCLVLPNQAGLRY